MLRLAGGKLPRLLRRVLGLPTSCSPACALGSPLAFLRACATSPPPTYSQGFFSGPPLCFMQGPPPSFPQHFPHYYPQGPPTSTPQGPPTSSPQGLPTCSLQGPPPACLTGFPPGSTSTPSSPPACLPDSSATPGSLPTQESSPSMPMELAVVRCVPSEERLTLSFTLEGSQRHMQREQTEPLGRALARIATNAAKAVQGGKAKKCKRSVGPASPPTVRLYYQEQLLPDELPNAEAWCQGAVLQVGEARYSVQRNPPALLAVQLPRHILAGFPVCPAPLRIEFGQLQASLFSWFREATGEPGGWAAAGQQRVYIPANADIGLRLKLRCTPGSQEGEGPARYGEPVELEASCRVEAGPGVCAFDQRHLYTQRSSGEDRLRTVSYNILADVYAQTEHSRTVLYPYCAPYALEADYRQTLLRKELSGYHADLLCLQEVDSSVFSDSLGPALDAFGLQGLFRLKEKQHEGLATFYRPDKLCLLSQHDISLSQALQAEPLHAELLEKLSSYETAKERLLQRSSQLQVSVFQCVHDSSRKICVANTHLYFHPKGGNIRLLQSAIALTHVHHVAYELYPGIPIIFCGDFNSIPSSGLYSFFISGSVSEQHEDWVSNGEEERCNMSLNHSFKLKSACGEPAYTNYVGGFHGCLDYIFIDSDVLEVEQVIPMPSHEEVTTHQALPSVSHPSDHIALVCDLKWK